MASSLRKWIKGIVITIVCIVLVPVVILIAALGALAIPSVQQKAVQTAVRVISEKTGIDASVGHFSVGLPFNVLLSDVFVGDGQSDTLAFVGLLDARLDITALPDSVSVTALDLKDVVAHTGDLISSVKIDGRIGRLSAGVDSFNPRELYFPITDGILENSDIMVTLVDTDDEEEAVEEAADTTSTGGIVIDLKDLYVNNVDFRLEPMGLKVDMGEVSTSTLVDLGATCFTVRRIDASDVDFALGSLEIPFGALKGDVLVDVGNDLITFDKVFVSVPSMDAQATLTDTRFDLETLLVSTAAKGQFAGSPVSLVADYDIDDEIYKATLDLGRTDVAKILEMEGSEIIVAGHVDAKGQGIDPTDPKMAANLNVKLDSCRYNTINVSGITLAANLLNGVVNGTVASPVHYVDSALVASLSHEIKFNAKDFLGPRPELALDAAIADIDVKMPSDTFTISTLDVAFKTLEGMTKAAIAMPGVDLKADAAMHALEIPTLLGALDGDLTLAKIDSLLNVLPAVNVDLAVAQDNPLRSKIQAMGFDLNKLTASLHTVGEARKLAMSLRTPALESIPEIKADLDAKLTHKNGIKLDGQLRLEDLAYDGKDFGTRTVKFDVRPDSKDAEHLVAHAALDDIPLEIAKQFVDLPEEIGIAGDIRARAMVSGLPDKMEIFAGITPVGVAAEYKPYDVKLHLGDQEITFENNKVELNGLQIIAADSTYVAMTGGVDVETMMLDVKLKSDRFEPTKLPKDGPIPVYGALLTAIDGTITGPVDSLLAAVDVTVLPETDITYPIDEKNLAQVSPAGTIKVGFNPQTGLNLGGQLDVPKGKIFFSPKFYPIMPFNIDPGSHIKFNGDIDKTALALSASQGAKAAYKPYGEVSRMVDFVTGVKVGGTLENINIGFYLDAPKDAVIQRELAETPEEDREGLAAVLLATGMYASESNEAAQMDGYAISSILQSRINAAASNNLKGKVNVEVGVANAKHGRGVETMDYNVSVSKSFFKDRLNIKVGGSVSDNDDVNKNSGSFINNLSAEYKLDSAGTVKARLFSKKDFQNIVDGELVKSGAGILYEKTFSVNADSLDRSLDLRVEGNVVYRSNNQIGPDALVALSKQNLFKKGDVFTTKVQGAYYWNLNRRQQLDPKRNDSYILGADFSLNFPYLQLGKNAHKYSGSTLYRLGYLNESISGDYNLHKIYGGLNYSFRQNKYISHSFSPLYLSVVLASGTSEKLIKDMKLNDLLKLFAGNEFIPSVGYTFSFNNYRKKDIAVNTALDIRVKESANLISGVMAACGRDFNQKGKTILGVDYDQFVKLHLELRNRFRLADRFYIATRALAGAVITYGNSVASPLSEAYSIGGPNSLRAFSPRTIGPGDFHNSNYSAQIFHTGDIKFELNAELRFPIVWKLNGAVFVDAGNVWNMRSPESYMSQEEIESVLKAFNLPRLYDSHLDASTFLNQIALGTGAGLRLDYESIVIRLDLGIAIHAPYDTGRMGYYNIPNMWRDGLRLNFGIGYPF